MKRTGKFLTHEERNRRIDETKNKSRRVGQESVILEDTNRREFMRYEGGELVEYDLTREGGRKIALRPDETAGLRDFRME
tara:strand:- start:2644 stop:2883 length:240 start_codon:yes stop_codon:yes gene_type:complete